MRPPSSSVCLGSVRTAVKLRSHEEFWCRDPEQNQDQTSDGRSSALLMVLRFSQLVHEVQDFRESVTVLIPAQSGQPVLRFTVLWTKSEGLSSARRFESQTQTEKLPAAVIGPQRFSSWRQTSSS